MNEAKSGGAIGAIRLIFSFLGAPDFLKAAVDGMGPCREVSVATAYRRFEKDVSEAPTHGKARRDLVIAYQEIRNSRPEIWPCFTTDLRANVESLFDFSFNGAAVRENALAG